MMDQAEDIIADVLAEAEEDRQAAEAGTDAAAAPARPDLEPADQLRLLEAMLFASAEPLSPQAMHERLPESADLAALLAELQALYDGRGVALVETGGAWAFRTSPDLADALVVEKDVSRKLSRAALETLAIVAYHQPVTRAEVENIRGVATHKGTLDTLMEMGWVKPGRRRETPGRPLTWVTTPGFLDHFGLESALELPGLDELKAAGLLDRRPAIDTVPDSRDLFDNPDESAAETLSDMEEDAAAAHEHDDEEEEGERS